MNAHPSMLSPNHRRGVLSGLAEVLISASLMLLVSGTAYFVMLLANRYASAGELRAGLQVNAAYALQRLYFDLHETSAASVTTLSSPQAIGFLTQRDTNGNAVTDSSGRPLWQAYLVYYVPIGSPQFPLLARRVVPASAGLPSATPAALTAAQLGSYCDGTGSAVGFGIQVLSVATASTYAVVQLTAQDQPGVYCQNRAAYNTTVYFDN